MSEKRPCPWSNRDARLFSGIVLEKGVDAVVAHWTQEIYAGRAVPPPQKPADADVVAFVRSNIGAIGYVGSKAKLAAAVKAVAMTE